ncbi:hypothetical protein [Actinoplanes sp. URMC 104]|uniref:hypothetical protein n=1 Tax=Actinoplanes sp. URMC 104 TaxID=3423409 RepID=UPI003F19E0DB
MTRILVGRLGIDATVDLAASDEIGAAASSAPHSPSPRLAIAPNLTFARRAHGL